MFDALDSITIIILILVALISIIVIYRTASVIQRGEVDFWLSMLAKNIAENLPADIIDEAGARKYLIEQIELFAKARGLEDVLLVVDYTRLVDRLLDFISAEHNSKDDTVLMSSSGEVLSDDIAWRGMISMAPSEKSFPVWRDMMQDRPIYQRKKLPFV